MSIYFWLNDCSVLVLFGGERRCTRNPSPTFENCFGDAHYHDYLNDYIFLTCHLLRLDEADPSCICHVHLCTAENKQTTTQVKCLKTEMMQLYFLCSYTQQQLLL